MSEAARYQEAEELANQVAALLEGRPLDVGSTALSLALAGVIAGYPLRDRDLVERQVVSILSQRVQQLQSAGLAASRHRH